MYSVSVSGVYNSSKLCTQQVNGLSNKCYKKFATRDKAKQDYSKSRSLDRSSTGVGKDANQIGFSRMNNFVSDD